tara:strand:- start:1496 stop:2353 length:858 start_codon:yes stop_codon:yes gene_type:complete
MTSYSDVKKALRKFAGVDLTNNRAIPDNWVVVKEETVTGDKDKFVIRQAVFPDTFTGYAKGMGEQTTGGYLGAGNRNLGIEIEVRDINTGEYGSDRVWENVDYSRQQEFFNNSLTVISRTLTTVSSISAPQERQGTLSQVGVQRNPSEWIVGDMVNVARPTLDGGGITIGYVVRVYPTTVDILWSPDAIHPKGWRTEEKKENLIYAGHNEEWRKTANEWLNDKFYAESEPAPPPAWTKMITSNPDEIEELTTSSSPLPISADVWSEADDARENFERMINPFLKRI